jgi:hypothetical protein
MSRVNHTGVTKRGQILEISFTPVHFSFFLKGKNTKKNLRNPSQGGYAGAGSLTT